MSSRSRSLGIALGWATAVTAIEAMAGRRIPSRSRAWLLAYSVLGVAGGAVLLARRSEMATPTPNRNRAGLLSGLALAGAGYQVGRAALHDRPTNRPNPTPSSICTSF